MIKLKTFFGRIGAYLHLRFIYRRWSSLYRLIWECKYRNYPVNTYKSFEELAITLDGMKWWADGWKQLWDAFSYPGRVQAVIDSADKDKSGVDCDEFACYSANALERSMAQQVLEPWKDRYVPMAANILTVTWISANGVYGGHNVCLITFLDSDRSPLAKYSTRVESFLDYYQPSTPQTDIKAVLQQILDNYTTDGKVLAWAIHTPRLELIEAHMG